MRKTVIRLLVTVVVLAVAGSVRMLAAALPPTEIEPTGKPMKLNNLVTELVRQAFSESGRAEYVFENPRDGWIFFSVPAEPAASGKVVVSLDGAPREQAILSREAGRHGEAMRWLPAGNHRLQVLTDGKPDGALLVRTMPEIILIRFVGEGDFHSPDGSPYKPGQKEINGMDRLYLYYWDFFDKNILDNVNVIQGGYKDCPEIKKWLAEGRKLISGSHIPSKNPDELHAFWSKGMNATNNSGILVDEFIPPTYDAAGRGFEPAVLAAVKRLRADQNIKGKFYAYLGMPWNATAKDCGALLNILEACGYYWVWEAYLLEQPNLAEAGDYMEKKFIQLMRDFRKESPGCEQRCIICPSILDAWDCIPDVDYKVWLDMQMNVIACNPAFQGVYGITAYQSTYADPEIMRWVSALYRHYFIEGNTGLLSVKYGYSLMMEHLKNANFAAGAAGWEVKPAEDGNIQFKKVGELPFKKGYLPMGPGVITMKRNAQKANIVRQEIRKLQPGRLYTFRMFSGDPTTTDLKTKHLYSHSVNIKGAKILPKERRQDVQRGDGAIKDSICWNYTYIVFKAIEPIAMLEISDWLDEKTPGGPIGQELIYDFIQVQPFFSVE